MRRGLLLAAAVVLLVGCGGGSVDYGPLAQHAVWGAGGPAYVGLPATLGLDVENSSSTTLVLDRAELQHVDGPLQVLGEFAAPAVGGRSYFSPRFPSAPYTRKALRALDGFVVGPHADAFVLMAVRLTKGSAASAHGVRLTYHSQSRGYRDDFDATYALTPRRAPVACRTPACRWNRIVDGWVADGLISASQAPAAHGLVRYGCVTCHTYRNIGATNLHAPHLTFGGPHRLSAAKLVAQMRCPVCMHPGSPMPSFARLPARELKRLAAFLAASR